MERHDTLSRSRTGIDSSLAASANVPRRSCDAVRTDADHNHAYPYLYLLLRARDIDNFRKKELQKGWDSLTSAGISGRYIEHALKEIAVADWIARHPQKRPSRSRDWAVPKGISRRQLNSLPRRIRDLATLIGRINEHQLYSGILTTSGPDVIQNALRPDWPGPAPSDFSQLARELDRYADALDRQLKESSRLRRGAARVSEPEFELKLKVVRLITAVQDVTGKPHWADLCRLLSATFAASVGRRNWAEDFTALRQFYADNHALIEPKWGRLRGSDT